MPLFRRTPPASEAVAIQEVRERHNLAQQVFFRREAAGWTQEELASRCGTTQAQVANIEAGKVNVTMNSMVKLAHAFGCLAHDLLRPLDEADDWERPDARDWGKWAPRAEEQRARSVVVGYLEVGRHAAYPSYQPYVNDNLALSS